MAYILLGTRVLLAAVLVAAVVGKGRAFAQFRESLQDWRVVPASLSTATAVAVIVLEAFLCVALVVADGAALRLVLVATALLFVALASAVQFVLTHRAAGASCACFGARQHPLRRRHVIRNLVLAGVAVLGAAVTTLPLPTTSAGGAVVAVAVGLGCSVAVIALDALAELVTPARPLRPRST